MNEHSKGGGGLHCETTTLGVLLRHAGLELTEPMVFGLGAGLSFVYWDSKRQTVPFLGGRIKPFEITQNFARRLGLDLAVRETTSANVAFDTVADAVDRGVPVGLQLDSYYLDYFSPRVHFAGHFVAMYDRDATHAHLVETAQQGGLVSTGLDSLARARAARGPMSARQRSFTIAAPDTVEVTPTHLVESINACAEAFLQPPISNLGHRGILTTAKRIHTWFDRIEEPESGCAEIAYMMEHAGTGGALFRNLYRDFLTEATDRLGDQRLTATVAEAATMFGESAELWTRLADTIERAGATADPTRLDAASEQLRLIHQIELDAMTALASLSQP